jgi:hypothetical protein
VDSLLLSLSKQVSLGRSTAGNPVSNDRKVNFLPPAVSLPQSD